MINSFSFPPFSPDSYCFLLIAFPAPPSLCLSGLKYMIVLTVTIKSISNLSFFVVICYKINILFLLNYSNSSALFYSIPGKLHSLFHILTEKPCFPKPYSKQQGFQKKKSPEGLNPKIFITVLKNFLHSAASSAPHPPNIDSTDSICL